MNKFAVFLINFYKRFLSDFLGSNCKYLPVCSDYAKECFSKYGFCKACCKVTWRILRCNPFSKGGIDLPCYLLFAWIILAPLMSENIVENEFMYLSTSQTGLRSGPGKQYPLVTTFFLKNYPVKVLKTLNEWVKVAFFAGEKGWIKRGVLKRGKYTTLVIIKEANMYVEPDKKSSIIAIIGKNRLVLKLNKDNNWIKCEVEFDGKKIKGWVENERVWGSI